MSGKHKYLGRSKPTKFDEMVSRSGEAFHRFYKKRIFVWINYNARSVLNRYGNYLFEQFGAQSFETIPNLSQTVEDFLERFQADATLGNGTKAQYINFIRRFYKEVLVPMTGVADEMKVDSQTASSTTNEIKIDDRITSFEPGEICNTVPVEKPNHEALLLCASKMLELRKTISPIASGFLREVIENVKQKKANPLREARIATSRAHNIMILEELDAKLVAEKILHRDSPLDYFKLVGGELADRAVSGNETAPTPAGRLASPPVHALTK